MLNSSEALAAPGLTPAQPPWPDPSAGRSPWPSITLLNPFAPYWAGLITCASQGSGLCISGHFESPIPIPVSHPRLCSGGCDTTLRRCLRQKRGRAIPCRAGAAGLRCSFLIQVSVRTCSLPFLSFTSRSLAQLMGMAGPGGRLGSRLRAGERNPVLFLLKLQRVTLASLTITGLPAIMSLNCAPSERYVETLVQYLQI